MIKVTEEMTDFQRLYWLICYKPVYKKENGLLCEAKTMCLTFKEMLKHKECTEEIRKQIKSTIKSHLDFENSETYDEKIDGFKHFTHYFK